MERSRNHRRGNGGRSRAPFAFNTSPKLSVSGVMGYLKGKSSLIIYQKFGRAKFEYRCRECWCRGYYVDTFTYDDQKHTETEFRAKLRRCLSNLHTRRGWRYMGVFERAPETGRLHFHGLFYIPESEMIGEITEKRDYSTKQHKMQTRHENNFFLEKFGRNDFEDIRAFERRNGNSVNYMLKYIEKTGEKLTYSRGIPAEIYKDIPQNDIKHYTAPIVKGYEPVYLC